jgi:NAD(P)-dependent dehydrogenase (short-subunit alcohol dehydrogenase family)
MRLKDKIAIVVGAGQSPGEGLGNGRATVLRFVQEGAKVLAVDNNLRSAEETVAIARQSNGECVAFEADVAEEATLAAMVETARRRWGRVDILHYNVGVSIAGGDAPLDQITEAAFDRIATINLRGAIMTCKQVLPLMRAQRAGVITTISSVAAWEQYPNVAYKATKAGMIAFTQQVAIQNARFGVRANVILPGLMDTPMAVDTRARASGKSGAEVAAARDARVPPSPQNGHGLGRCERRPFPGFRRSEFHHRCRAPGRWRRPSQRQLSHETVGMHGFLQVFCRSSIGPQDQPLLAGVEPSQNWG